MAAMKIQDGALVTSCDVTADFSSVLIQTHLLKKHQMLMGLISFALLLSFLTKKKQTLQYISFKSDKPLQKKILNTVIVISLKLLILKIKYSRYMYK